MNSRPLNKQDLTNEIKAEALRLGFFACGIAEAAPVEKATADHVKRWLKKGNHANMDYMANHTDKRLDPRLLMTGARSIICVALNYAPHTTFPDGEYQLAAYAIGLDYHDIMKEKLCQLAAKFGYEDALFSQNAKRKCRIFADTGPVLERYWAEKAGLGWTGKNHQLIIPHAGSMFFLGELIVDEELVYDSPMENRCGNCRRCIEACPTKAITEGHEMNAARCLSYQTIENKSALSKDIIVEMGNTIYGCDRCLKACPWNRFATPNDIPELQPKAELLEMTKQQWENLTEEEYRKLFKGSAVKRAKYAGLMRNIQAVACHSQEKQLPLPLKMKNNEQESK